MDLAEPPRRGRCAAIESSLRAAGRIVVCVDAAADVSTAMIRNLSKGEPSTRLPVALSTSSAFVGEELRPLHRLRGDGDDHVGAARARWSR